MHFGYGKTSIKLMYDGIVFCSCQPKNKTNGKNLPGSLFSIVPTPIFLSH